VETRSSCCRSAPETKRKGKRKMWSWAPKGCPTDRPSHQLKLTLTTVVFAAYSLTDKRAEGNEMPRGVAHFCIAKCVRTHKPMQWVSGVRKAGSLRAQAAGGLSDVPSNPPRHPFTACACGSRADGLQSDSKPGGAARSQCALVDCCIPSRDQRLLVFRYCDVCKHVTLK
jgi:hypothetical protein